MAKECACVHYDNGKCKKFSDNEVTSWCVEGPCKDKLQSNADRIRAMSDKELVAWAHKQIGCGFDYFPCGVVCDGKCEAYSTEACDEKILKWLKQPVEDQQ